MKIAFLCPALSRTVGGIFEIERRLAQSLALIPGTHLEVFGSADEHTVADLPAWHPLKPRFFVCTGGRSFRYSSTLRDAFLATTADAAHLHALWMYNSILIHHWSQKNRSPYVVTPNGMLEPWALRNSGWKKRIASLLYERRMLSNAACIQANTEKEAADIRAFGLKNPICIIPNGIDLPEIGNAETLKTETLKSECGKAPLDANQKSEIRNQKVENRNEFQLSALPISAFAGGRKVLLYLGRIHPKKGLANLLKAWAKHQKSEIRNQKSEEWVLAIAGWDQGGHEDELKRLATELGLAWADIRGKAEMRKTEMRKEESTRSQERETDFGVSGFQNFSVLFLGPQFNDAKAAAYANCNAFVLPSLSEGLPMVVLEAWAYGKPVLMTPECNLPEGFAANAAIRIEPGSKGIAQGLEQLIRSPSSGLCSLGTNGRALVAEKFTWPKIASDMKSVYEWMLGGGPKPGCVV